MNLKKIVLLVIFIFFLIPKAYSDLPHYIDFRYVLNESVAGKKAQTTLKKKLNDGIVSLNKKEKLQKS